MKNPKAEFARRLKLAMEDVGLDPKPAVLEKKFNLNYFGKKPVTLHAVMRWMNGKSLPTDDKIKVLAKLLKVEPEELTGGTKPVLQVREEKGAWEKSSDQEREAFEAFLALPAFQKKVVREVILAFAKK
jgi:transcriptional regulator with XRE-family HTH domain